MLRVPGLVSLFEGRDSVFEGKIGFESMHWIRDAEKKKPSGLRDLHRVGMTGLKNPIGYPLTACPDYMKQRLLETLATDIYFPLKKA